MMTSESTSAQFSIVTESGTSIALSEDGTSQPDLQTIKELCQEFHPDGPSKQPNVANEGTAQGPGTKEWDEKRKKSFRTKQMREFYGSVTEEPRNSDEPDVRNFFKLLRDHRLQAKLVYVLTVVSIVVISHFVLSTRCMLPYYYTISTPVLLLLRLIMYWKLKYQYFMLDFCYFGNLFWYIYLWVAPDNEFVFAVGFAVANGPLIWALLIFRNSLIFHSLDKVTSLYIHILPPLLSFVIRWYPEETSIHWYKPFTECTLTYSIVWLIFVPFGFSAAHQLLFSVLVDVILKPSSDYLNSYRFLLAKEESVLFRACNLFGERFRFFMYILLSQLLTLVMLSLNLVWYNFFAAHCFILILFTVIAIFNGATYYIDVFSLEGKRNKFKLNAALKKKNMDNQVETDSPSPQTQKVFESVVIYVPDKDDIKTSPID